MSSQTFENPFEVDRLSDSSDLRTEWDVPSVNADMSRWIEEDISAVRQRKGIDPKQKIRVLLGSPGRGKTHLFGRLAQGQAGRVHLVYVPQVLHATRPVAHLQWHIVESLFEAAPGRLPALAQFLSRLLQGSFEAYFDWLPPSLGARHQALRQRLEDDPLAVLEVLAPVRDLLPYHKLADSVASAHPDLQADVVRTLVLGVSPAAQEARCWLRGEELPESRLQELRLGQQCPVAARVLHAVAVLFQRLQLPIFICIDQLEMVLNDANGPKELTTELMGWLHSIPNLVMILSCVAEDWKEVEDRAYSSFPARVATYQLPPLSPEQAVELVRRRLRSWVHFQPTQGETWPFDPAAIAAFATKNQLSPRGFVQECRKRFSAWLDKRITSPLKFDDRDGPTPDSTAEFFLQEWNQELLAIQQAGVSPENMQEERLFEAVHQALQIVHEGKASTKGIQLLSMQLGALKPGNNDPRPSLALRLGVDKAAVGVVVAVTRNNGGVRFGHYVNALEETLGGEVAGAVLVRPSSELTVGPTAAARKKYEKAISDGFLRPFPLDDERLTFESLECLLRILQRAAQQDLQPGGQTVSVADCRKLVIQTKLLDNLKLFDFIFTGWPAVEAARGTAAAKAEPVKAALSVSAPDAGKTSTGTRDAAPPSKGAEPRGAAGGTEPPSKSESPQAWAEDLLAKIADKLRKWGLPVEPLGVEVGPSFARLKVRPRDETDINKVRNKAENLRLHLSLPGRPLIGFQAGYISVDVQRPQRDTVRLGQVLAARPAELGEQPAFPVGVDVAGQTHWLNLADTANCHLLIAGTTGSGKSEFMKVILAALAHHLAPDQVQFVLIDPKRVTFNFRGESPYFRAPVAHDNAEAMPLIEWCFTEMEDRYKLLQQRHRQNFSELEGADARPRVVLIFDEFADLILDKASKKELEPLLKRLGAKARAAGIHLVLGTQRTEASVVTPLLRSNLPGRISLQVITDRDSKLILDAPGASNLLGRGDLLWRQGGDLLRLQSPYISNDELEAILRI